MFNQFREFKCNLCTYEVKIFWIWIYNLFILEMTTIEARSLKVEPERMDFNAQK